MSARGMGALAGGVMGAGASNLESAEKILNVEEEAADAISHGHWVIVVHCYTESEAARAQALLLNRRIVRRTTPTANRPSDLVAEPADIQDSARSSGRPSSR